MSIVIYTYRDPYKMTREPFWNEVTTCPYFCASQTLANGVMERYGSSFKQGRISTVKKLVDSVFSEWQSTNRIIRQNTIIDNIITSDNPEIVGLSNLENVRRAFLYNREEVFKSIRVLFELNINPDDVLVNVLNPEQKFILSLYRALLKSAMADLFSIKMDLDLADVEEAVSKAIAIEDDNGSVSPSPAFDRVVIHGVHQFSPLILRAIEEIAKYKKVILLFNYQPQYKNIYQSWIDIYSSFDCPITDFGGAEFKPDPSISISYEGNVLADNLGKLAEGKTGQVNQRFEYELVEFDNMTEFAGYVASAYKAGRAINPHSPLSAMREQFYAADSSVNEILKIYFPEQFGERQFLNYPLGHFFIAVANMWDMANNKVIVSDVNDIKECLMAGILEEDYLGELSTIFEKAESLFEGCETIDEMLSWLKRLRKNKRRLQASDDAEALSRVSYYTLSGQEIEKLRNALEELKDLSLFFYQDFEKRPNNFRSFYGRLKEYLHDDILDSRNLDREFEDIVRRVYLRLEEVDDIDATASFECLKSTMSIYLTQEEKAGNGANWIVRDFEQIDGDIMRSGGKRIEGEEIVYHFACLSDEDINSVRTNVFPWPLDDEFFTVAQDPVDWKYQVYVKARKEYKHFKEYALLFGLEFNRAKCKLSYVKRDGEKSRTAYSRLLMLGATVVPYENMRLGRRLADAPSLDLTESSAADDGYCEIDGFRFRICKYRFLIESLLEKGSVYKDTFLLSKYMEALLENRVKTDLQGFAMSEVVVQSELASNVSEYERYFPFVRSADKIDAVSAVKRRLLSYESKGFPKIGEAQQRAMEIREVFLHQHLLDSMGHDVLDGVFEEIKESELSEMLSRESLDHIKYEKNVGLWCRYCPVREVCATPYSA